MRTGWNVMPFRPFWKLKDADSGRKWGFKRSTLEVPKFSLLGGWPTPLKILVSWDDYSQYDGKITNVPNHQPVLVFPEIAGKLWWSASCLQGATFQRAVGGLPKRHITETVGGTYQCKPHGCFLKLGYPQIIHLNRVFHHKSSILGYPHFRDPPMCQPKMAQNSSPRLAAHRPSFQIAEARVVPPAQAHDVQMHPHAILRGRCWGAQIRSPPRRGARWTRSQRCVFIPY